MTTPIRIAFQGEFGAYSELAARQYCPAPVETRPCKTFEEVFEVVTAGECSYGILPIENSLAGSIHRNYDLMLQNEVQIIGEYHLRVEHCLMALPGVTLQDIRRVHSHPQALAQCNARLHGMGVEIVPEYDTAGSARLLRDRGDRQAAALASRRAALAYGLNILVESMEDNPLNFTRFLIVTAHPPVSNDTLSGDYKTSVVFSLHNQPGALFRAMGVFALRDIDLVKIESRPIPGSPWEYMFYIDFAGYSEERNCRRALEHLQELAPYFRVLGSYPRHRVGDLGSAQ